MNDPLSASSRAQVHAALGEPARLAIVDLLRLRDASPGELRETFNMQTNLVAHHLKVLEAAGLVERTRSEGDQRRVYVRLVPATLASLSVYPLVTVPRVLFVCSHNSARSQIAAALWATRSPVPTASAGTKPAGRIHPRTVRLARRHKLKLLAASTASYVDVLEPEDLVVAVCDNAHEDMPADANRIHWSVPDPASADTDDAFEKAYIELVSRIDRLSSAIGAR